MLVSFERTIIDPFDERKKNQLFQHDESDEIYWFDRKLHLANSSTTWQN